MPRLGRPPKPEPTYQWCFRIPASLSAKWDLVLVDPVTGRINPNVKQEIFIPILYRVWEAAMSGQSTIDISDIVAHINERMAPL
jgi:hypothetical protein